MKKGLNVFLVVCLLLNYVTWFGVFGEETVQTQVFECYPFPTNTTPETLGKFMDIYNSKGPEADERQYLISSSTATVDDWGGTGLTRFLNSQSFGDVIYKFDLANTATGFSVDITNQGNNYSVYASKDNVNWVAIGVDNAATISDRRVSTYPDNSDQTMVSNMLGVLSGNDEKVIYIKLSLNGANASLNYQSLKVTATYPPCDSMNSSSYRVAVVPDGQADMDMYYADSLRGNNLIPETNYLSSVSASGAANWGGTGIFRFIAPNQYAVYRFDLDDKTVDFNVSIFAQATKFKIDVSEDGNTWIQLYEVSDNDSAQKLYTMPESAKTGVREVLKDNPEKIVYVRVMGVEANQYNTAIAYKYLTIDYSYYLLQNYYEANKETWFGDLNRSIGFDTNTDTENGYIFSNNGTSPFYWEAISHNVRSVPDGKSIVYKFDLEDSTISARFSAKVKFDYKFSVSSNGETWGLITADSVNGESSGYGLDFDITSALTNNPNKTIYIKCEASQDGIENTVGYAGLGLFLLEMKIDYVLSKPEEKLTENQNIRLDVYPNTEKQSDIDKFNSTIGAVDERPFLYDAGTSVCADWNSTGVVRFTGAGESVIYKYDLNDRAIDFTLSAYHQGYGYKVEASKDLLNWYNIGEDLPTSSSIPATPQITALTPQDDSVSKDNIKKVLTYNPEKTVYIKISAKNPGHFIYWYTTLTQTYNISDQAVDLPTVPTGPVDEYAGIHSFTVNTPQEKSYTHINDYTDVSSEGFRYTQRDGYITYKFELPSTATVAIVQAELRGEFLLKASKDNNNWEDIGRAELKSANASLNQRIYEFRLSRFLQDNPTKTIYIRCTDPTLEDGFGFQIKKMAVLWKNGITPTADDLKVYDFENEKKQYSDTEPVFNAYFFGPDTSYEKPFLQYNYEAILGDFFGSVARYMLFDSFVVLRYPFPSNTVSAKFLINVINNHNVSISTDCKNWTLLGEKNPKSHDMSHFTTYEFDVTQYVNNASGKQIYIKLKNGGGDKSAFVVPWMEMDFITTGPAKKDAVFIDPIDPDYGEIINDDEDNNNDEDVLEEIKTYDDIWYGDPIKEDEITNPIELPENSDILPEFLSITEEMIDRSIDELEEGKTAVQFIVTNGGKITQSALEKLKEKGLGLKIIIVNESEEIQKIMEFASIESTEEFKFRASEVSPIEESAGKYFDESKTIYSSFAVLGNFPGKIKLTVLNTKSMKKGVKKEAYYYDKASGNLKLLNGNIAMTSDEKYIQFVAENGSDFLITSDIKAGLSIKNPIVTTPKAKTIGIVWIVLIVLIGVLLLAGAVIGIIFVLKKKNKLRS